MYSAPSEAKNTTARAMSRSSCEVAAPHPNFALDFTFIRALSRIIIQMGDQRTTPARFRHGRRYRRGAGCHDNRSLLSVGGFPMATAAGTDPASVARASGENRFQLWPHLQSRRR